MFEEFDLDLKTVIPFRGVCTPGAGPDLSRYPNLAHVPDRGTITHLAGVTIEQIAQGHECQTLASRLTDQCEVLGVTFNELLDALRYARANKMI